MKTRPARDPAEAGGPNQAPRSACPTRCVTPTRAPSNLAAVGALAPLTSTPVRATAVAE